MRRVLYTLAVGGLICGFAKFSGGVHKPVDMVNGYTAHKIITMNGLHVALPAYLRNIPLEIMLEP
jgi:hypothetical protein